MNSAVNSEGWTRVGATADNDYGVIVGNGVFDGKSRALTATPVPEPGGGAAFASIFSLPIGGIGANQGRTTQLPYGSGRAVTCCCRSPQLGHAMSTKNSWSGFFDGEIPARSSAFAEGETTLASAPHCSHRTVVGNFI